ncbi:MAG: hypothetical protein KGZ33_06215 [Alkaliphilus sp.]|nr:hypothetical protein [Alkaliphilus sp.]
MSNKERITQELNELKHIYESLDEIDQKKLEEALIMLRTKFGQRVRA